MSKNFKRYLLFVFSICFAMVLIVCCVRIVRHVKHTKELNKELEAIEDSATPDTYYEIEPVEGIEERTITIDGKEYTIYVNE